MYVDETGFAPTTQRDYGRAPRGQKVHGARNGQRRPRTSLIGGQINNALIASMLFDGTCNTEVFNQWLAEMLLPALKPGAVIVLDNATFHKSPVTRELIEKAGCKLVFLPPYSPDLNPIEKTWANIKKLWKRFCDRPLDQVIVMSKCF